MQSIFLIGGEETQILSPDDAGGKAANLSRMAALGLPVPPAFVIPTLLSASAGAGDSAAQTRLDEALAEGIDFLEKQTGRKFGDRRRPLLVSVRSGAARSMPGMLETVLNVGCTADATSGLVRMSGNPRFAWDCRRRFLQGYLETVLGLDPLPLESLLRDMTRAEGVAGERDLDGEALERFVEKCLDHAAKFQADVSDKAREQLGEAARAVIASWDSEKARGYRRLQHFEDLKGTAITVQAMVFGNFDLASGSGVAFSRDPSTGGNEQVMDLLFDAQGEDVVSGRRTPENGRALRARWPGLADELSRSLALLERDFRDVQDVEFTIESGKLWLLQTRAAKRTPRAALRFAIDHVAEGLLSSDEALARLGQIDEDALKITRFDSVAEADGHGVAAAPGVACGRVAFDSDAAVRMRDGGHAVILVRPDTSTSDVSGFSAAAGVLTATGGRTAHAALVARQMGKPCVVGCPTLSLDMDRRVARLGAVSFHENDWLSIDGDSGAVFARRMDISSKAPTEDLAVLASWRSRAIDARPDGGRHILA